MLQPSKSRSGFGNGDRSIDREVCLHWIAYTLRYRPNLIPPAICSPVPFSGRTGGISVLRRSVPSVLPAGTALWTAIPSSSTEKNAASSLNAQPTVLPAVSAAGSSPPKSKSIKQHPVLFYPLKVSSCARRAQRAQSKDLHLSHSAQPNISHRTTVSFNISRLTKSDISHSTPVEYFT